MSLTDNDESTNKSIQLQYGFFEDVDDVSEVKNLDVYDTLRPLWSKKDEMDEIIKRLMMCIAVTNNNIMNLKNKIYQLETQNEKLKEELHQNNRTLHF